MMRPRSFEVSCCWIGYLSVVALSIGCCWLAIVAGRASAAILCPNEQIRQQQGTEYLPNCMALELVSPPVKGNRAARTPAFSASGERILYQSPAALGGTLGLLDPLANSYVATRTVNGWKTAATAPPGEYGFGWGGQFGSGEPRVFSPSFDRWLSFQATQPQIQDGQMTVFEAGIASSWVPRSPLLKPLDGHHSQFNVLGARFLAVSADFSHIIFEPGDFSNPGVTYLPGDPRPTMEGGTPSINQANHNSYVLQAEAFGGSTLSLLARDSAGKVWGGNCGTVLAGGESSSGATDARRPGGRNQGAISTDGTLIYFSTRPAQPEGAPCPLAGETSFVNPASNEVTIAGTTQPFAVGQSIKGGSIPAGTTITAISGQTITLSNHPSTFEFGVALSAFNPTRIMERREAPTGIQISELVPGGPVAGSDFFEGASLDGQRIYFTSNRQLADSDTDSGLSCNADALSNVQEGCDLYLYEKLPNGAHELIQVSAGEATASHPTPGAGAGVFLGAPAISGDGSHVYYVARGVLTDDLNPEGESAGPGELNLYAYERDAVHSAGTTSFIGRLDDTCTPISFPSGHPSVDCREMVGTGRSYGNDSMAVPIAGNGPSGETIGGDGHILVFESAAELTADDRDGKYLDIYRYDDEAGSLECVSCAPDAVDEATFDVGQRFEPSSLFLPGPDYAERYRWVSEDGQSIVFTTAAPLLPSDTDGKANPYLWYEGELTRLPATGALPGSGPGEVRPAVSANGDGVAFESAAQLLPEDGDTAEDVYVARVGGGYPSPSPSSGCEGSACQGAPRPVTSPGIAASGSFSGRGNVRQKRRTGKNKGRLVKQKHKRHRRRGGSHRGSRRSLANGRFKSSRQRGHRQRRASMNRGVHR